jgi:hypothetical protein
MKAFNLLRAAIILIGIVLSACAPAGNPSVDANVGGGKSLPDVSFSGVIESIAGGQWTINGQPMQVDSSVLRDGPFAVGDTVQVQASVAEDGSVTVQRIESPSAVATVEADSSTPQAPSSMPAISSTSQAPVFDDHGNEILGTVDAITDTSITVGGQTYTFAAGIEIKGEIVAGAAVKLHFTVNPDGTLSVREIEFADPAQTGDDNSGDDSSSHDVNDDHGGATNTSDDGLHHDANDDHGSDSNHDNNDETSGGNSGSGS